MDLPRRENSDRIVLLEQIGADRWEALYEVWAAINDAGGEVVILVETEGQ
jgi:hypothetical protein